MEPNCIKDNMYPESYLRAIYDVFLKEKEKRAIQYIQQYVHQYKGKIIGTLSGKDSLVSTHLAIRAVGVLSVYISRYVGRRKLPDEVVEELVGIGKHLGARIILGERPWGPHETLFQIIAKELDDVEVIISGLRIQEDGRNWIDRIYINNRVVNVVTPIAYWRHSDVWAYILQYNIPIPKAYCSHGTVPWASLQSLVF